MSATAQKTNIILLPTRTTLEERLQNRIDLLIKDINAGDGNMDHLHQIMTAIHDYLIEYEDPNLLFASIRIKEAGFWIDEFLCT